MRLQLQNLVASIDRLAPEEGINRTKLDGFGCFRTSRMVSRSAMVTQPVMLVLAQGKKTCFLEDRTYGIEAGEVLVRFYPVIVDAEVNQASPERPFLAAGLGIDLNRIADILTKIDRIDGGMTAAASIKPSSVISFPLTESLLSPLLRLFDVLESERDTAMLGEAIVDEIYYRLLCDGLGGAVRQFLWQRGGLLRISRAIDHIHAHMDQPISVSQLAEIVNMSNTSFFENFKAIMHVPPLQYVKSIKLCEAQKLISEGKKASEAGYLVGYNSPAQFSREYKRKFGFSPSETLVFQTASAR